jgi:hypothetical protein
VFSVTCELNLNIMYIMQIYFSFKGLVTDLSPRRPGFDPRLVRVRLF